MIWDLPVWLAAWRPFLEPLDLHEQWLWFLFPLLLAIAVVYRTLHDPKESILGGSLGLGLYILAVMVVIGAILWVVVEVA